MANALSSLFVLQPDQFEGDHFEQEDLIQARYYKGAPPQWVNFYLAERNKLPFVKRAGYEVVKRLIKKQEKKARKTVIKIDLLHQPGTGGSTLAMQVLWDLRQDLLCMTLNNTDATPKVISNELIKLGSERRKTVLLLLDNVDTFKENLQKGLYESLIDEVDKTNIEISVPVVIILNCIRKDELPDEAETNTVVLRSELQIKEKEDFDNYFTSNIRVFFRNECTKFYGFNIIQRDFDSEYVQEVCNSIVPTEIQPEGLEVKLFAILALVNSYAPGSYLALDHCERFLGREKSSSHSQDLLHQEMTPYSDLFVTFSTIQNLAYVHVVHPMIAKKCIKLLLSRGLSISQVTKLYLKTFCEKSPDLIMTAKTMLIMREVKVEKTHDTSAEKKPKKSKPKFSKLIHLIKIKDRKQLCIDVLKMATKIFENSPTFPQTLARCYYLMDNDSECTSKEDYEMAKHWANVAIKRHPNNSFIMDTLGQVHKHHLFHYLNIAGCCLCKNCPYPDQDKSHFEVLRLGRLAINAFEKEEEAAEKEETEESRTDTFTNISRIFNTRGKLGYLQVASKIFTNLERMDKNWENALIGSQKVPRELQRNLKGKYVDLVHNLRAEVNSRCRFFEKYLTYSKPGPLEDNPSRFGEAIDECNRKYLGMKSEDAGEITATLTNLQTFLQRQEANFRPFFCFKTSSVESFHLALLQDEGRDLGKVVMRMRQAYEKEHSKYFRSRYLVPLYMRSKKEGWKTLVELQLQLRDIEIKEFVTLKRFNGRVNRPNVWAIMNGRKIKVQPHNKENVLRNGKISLYMGFNIEGPIAFNIKYE